MHIINVNAGRHMGTHDQWLQQFETELQITPVNDGYKTTFLVNSQDNILAPAIGKAKLVNSSKNVTSLKSQLKRKDYRMVAMALPSNTLLK